MADYAYAFKAPPHVYQHSYYQPPPTQWDAAQPATNSPPQQHYRQAHTPSQPHAASPAQQPPSQPPQQRQQSPPQAQQPPVALLWTSLEPWMDDEYARQVCALLGWDAHVRVPLPDSNSGAAANNMGFAVLTFPSQAAAAAALAQVSAPANSVPSVAGGTASASGAAAPGTKMTMPNSSLPFALAWAPAGLASSSTDTDPGNNAGGSNGISSAGTNANGPNSTASANGNGMAAYSGAYPRAGAATGGVASPTSSPVSVMSMGSGPVTGGGGAPMMTNGNGMGGFVPGIGMGATTFPGSGGAPQYPREYSIFVGDLAPETSNSDLVAVFRNPVLGLRNDRAPKFIRPFTSCKSAKIMLDPVTGVSRGYGFVRFTDEADQQRALIEMHGLYCLSRPMRISPATAKFKSPAQGDAPGLPASTTAPAALGGLSSVTSVPVAEARLPSSSTAPSVSALMAGGTPAYFPPASGTQGVSAPPPPGQEYFAQVAAQQATVAAPQFGADAATTAEWKHHAHARAILGNLMGPNGEQLTSTDPYNTTVFVGGLSPLVGEDTLRTFFVPFGEIHYVKVPVGKHCGFVQFVRKADAELAIEKMQGFPVGGSRIRLSWGRSQYKAAQAAAQAAHSAALQAVQAPQQQPQQQQPAAAPGPQPAAAQGITPQMLAGLTQEQAIMLLQKFGIQGILPSLGSTSASGGDYADNTTGNTLASGSYTAGTTGANGGSFVATPSSADAYRSGFHTSSSSGSLGEAYVGKQASSSNTRGAPQQPQFTEENLKVRRDEGPFGFQRAYEVVPPSFSPFSPDPNQQSTQQQPQQQGTGLYAAAELFGTRRDSYSSTRRDSYSSVLPHPSKAFVPGFFPGPAPVNIVGGGSKSGLGAGSPTRGYGGGGFSGSPPAFQVNRYQVHEHAPPRQPISRPRSGSARGAAVGASAGERDDWDSMHDVNGTLASLDLSREREPGLDRTWRLKSPITESASEESTSSGGSVQFRMTMGRTPSP